MGGAPCIEDFVGRILWPWKTGKLHLLLTSLFHFIPALFSFCTQCASAVPIEESQPGDVPTMRQWGVFDD